MARPRADDYNEKRRYILDNAAKLFSEQGFSGTSIAAIADYCGTSKALLYHYYESKEALLFDMLNSHCQLLVETSSRAVSGRRSAEERLGTFISELMALYSEAKHKHVVLLNDLHCLPSRQQKQVRDLEKQVVQTLKELVLELRPELAPATCTALSMYLMGAINWTYTWFNPRGSMSAEDFAALATALFLKGLVNYDED
ncbi:MAG: TetR/AcrR family transcriptional regulator [Candidatus Obscuribacterales bacterium]